MRITRGRHAGKTATLKQFANDWISATVEGDPKPVIISPASVQLDPEEIPYFEASKGTAHVGVFWEIWELTPTRRFKHLRHPSMRRSNREQA